MSSPGVGGARFNVAIPARFGASRLPGKPLRLLAGRPLIAHVWDRAVESGADQVVVATDDERIASAVESFGGRAVMTSADHPSGTDRLAELVALEKWADDTIVVNLQGDEPCIDGALVRRVADALADRPEVGIATLATPITDPQELFDENAVKVVLDDAGLARYFSRAPIPWVRGAFAAGPVDELPAGVTFLRHLGLYGYRAAVVTRLAGEASRPCERAEALEQLRALAVGIDIHVSITDRAPGPGVDTEEDLARAERALAERGHG